MNKFTLIPEPNRITELMQELEKVSDIKIQIEEKKSYAKIKDVIFRKDIEIGKHLTLHFFENDKLIAREHLIKASGVHKDQEDNEIVLYKSIMGSTPYSTWDGKFKSFQEALENYLKELIEKTNCN